MFLAGFANPEPAQGRGGGRTRAHGSADALHQIPCEHVRPLRQIARPHWIVGHRFLGLPDKRPNLICNN